MGLTPEERMLQARPSTVPMTEFGGELHRML